MKRWEKISLAAFLLIAPPLLMAQSNPGLIRIGTVAANDCAVWANSSTGIKGVACSAVNLVTAVFGRTGSVVAQTGDYTVSQVTGAAPLNSPALTGTPTAPTAAPGTNTTQIASTAFATAAGPGNGANPTAQVGASAVNGAATTFMRSDAAPPLASGAAAANVGTLGGQLAGTLPNPTLTPGAAGCLVANNTAGSTGPTCGAASTWMDRAFCNTVGYVITRISGTWVCSNAIPANLKWFGAAGDGTTDDTAVFQNVITTLGLSNIYCPTGNYLISGSITINDNVNQLLQGNCTLKVNGSVTIFNYAGTTASTNTSFRTDGISFINVGTVGASRAFNWNGADTSHANNRLVVTNALLVSGFNHAFEMSFSYGVFDNIKADSNAAVWFGGRDASFITISNVLATNGTYVAFWNDTVGNDGTTNGITFINVAGVFNTNGAFSFLNTDAITIIGGSSDNSGSGTGSGQAGVYCEGCTNFKATNVYNASAGGGVLANHIGFWFKNSINGIVAANTIVAQSAGVYIDNALGGNSNFTLANNDFRGNLSDHVYLTTAVNVGILGGSMDAIAHSGTNQEIYGTSTSKVIVQGVRFAATNWYDVCSFLGVHSVCGPNLWLNTTTGVAQAPIIFPSRTVTTGTTDTATSADYSVFWNSVTAGAKAQTIPQCTGALAGQLLNISDERNTATVSNITITPAAGTINAAGSLAIILNGGSFMLQCDGVSASNWVVLAKQ